MNTPIKLLLVALYPQQYPAVGESLGLSQIAGSIWSHFSSRISYFKVIDMVTYGRPMTHEYMEDIAANRPNIICFSINYGTCGYFKWLIEETRRRNCACDTLYILGGPLPTYRPDEYLRDGDPRVVVVRGEGEEAVIGVISAYLSDGDLSQINNISYYAHGTVQNKPQKVLDLKTITYTAHRRHHLLNTSHYPVYVERSRGCNWAQCAFCLRGLLDGRGTAGEYRLFTNDRIFAELAQIRDVGKHIVTFADEDFLTGNVELDMHFLLELLEYKKLEFPDMRIIFSASVQKLFRSDWKEDRRKKAQNVLQLLKQIGTERVFIGVESGSPTQLRRFCKAHSVEDARHAIHALNEGQMCYEVGFIMFDPLCTLREIKENIAFIAENGLLHSVSSLDNSLRLQKGSRYFQMAKEQGVCCSAEPDRETLVYDYRFVDPEVQVLHDAIGCVRPYYELLHYPLKSYSRAACSEYSCVNSRFLQQCLMSVRGLYLAYLSEAVELVGAGRGHSISGAGFLRHLKSIANKIRQNIPRNTLSTCLSTLEETIISVCSELLSDANGGPPY